VLLSILAACQVLARADAESFQPDVDDNSPSPAVLRFEQTDWDRVQEGYVTLSWKPVAGASEYRVHGDSEIAVYRGRFPQAFVSGLADGQYEFHVHALDARGTVIASSLVPARVVVEHWSLPLAYSLFACGFVVFLAIVAVIGIGSWMSRSSAGGGSVS